MKKVEDVKKEMLAILCELQNTKPVPHLKKYLETRLQTIVDILEDDVPEAYYEQLEEFVTL